MKRDIGHEMMWRTHLIMIPRVVKRIYFISWRRMKALLKLGTTYSMEELMSLRV